MGTIVVSNLGKAYKQYPTRWSRLLEWVLPGDRPRHHLKWVMRDVNFSVRAGEAMGIIGINGAGKSTLLKMITGTTRPTTGHISITGHVAALLELGMGFHPDFTGRQNVFMAGQLLGHSAETIAGLMPAIEAFAEIGDYIDQPVRLYSSGMQMRLAFSVATAVRPDILIVDEALSVGDAYFQHKSFDRIREFREQGTTLLIVSHDKQAIQSLCDRAVLLDGGRMAMEGEPEAVMDYYNALLAGHQNQAIRQEAIANGRVQTISGSGEASISSVTLLNEGDQVAEVFDVGAPMTLAIDVTISQPISRLVLGFMIKDRLGQTIYGTNTHHLRMPVKDLEPAEVLRYRVTFNADLGPGSYSFAVALTTSESHVEKNFEWRDLAATFTIVNCSQDPFAGCAWLKPKLSLARGVSV